MSDSGHGSPRPRLPPTIRPRTPWTRPSSATASASRSSSSSRHRRLDSMPPRSGPAVRGVLTVLLEGGQRDVGELVGVVHAAVGDLDLDLSGVEVAQLDEGPDR